jgi:hypothetical protein
MTDYTLLLQNIRLPLIIKTFTCQDTGLERILMVMDNNRKSKFY